MYICMLMCKCEGVRLHNNNNNHRHSLMKMLVCWRFQMSAVNELHASAFLQQHFVVFPFFYIAFICCFL